MRVLVTGGAGFIGSHLVERLLDEGHEVTAIDNFDPFYESRIKWKNLERARLNSRFRLLQLDILELEAIEKELGAESFDSLVHLAAAAGVRPSIDRPRHYARVNVEGTASALELARRLQIRGFIFGSSSSVYGDSAVAPYDEGDTASNPISPYAATKRAGELLCFAAHGLSNLSVLCLRFFTAYGPRQRPDLAIHRFVSAIERGEPIKVFGNGTTRRDYCYVDDIVGGITAALAFVHRQECYEIVNLGGGRPVSLISLVREIETAVNKKADIQWCPPQPGDVKETFASTVKAERLLGFSPAIHLEDGLRNFVHWYRAQAT